ncbi:MULTISPECIES: ABC transporter substrate-binding protein [Methanobacterium]|jgi:NitT/TauT family transport system substrate-binding protein|uniref:ABC transporter substrate-binding protein n=1 Tax=Methanobacterium TaxID=2160 RepID=UPI000A8A4417|nr:MULTISPECIES: ABC transporter substrate-binding protein [Methanobacterium]
MNSNGCPHYYKTFDELSSVNAVLKQFEGKKIGTPSKRCIPDVIIRELTKNLDIEIKNFPWADFIPDAVEEVEIAAGVGTPSLASVTSRRFSSNVVIPLHKPWPYNPSYDIVVREELIDESPEFITDFLKAHEEATCNLIRLHPEQAAEIALKEVKVVDEDFVLDTYKISPKYCAGIPEEYRNSTLKFIPVLQRLGYMKGDLNQENIFNLEFIKKIHPEPAHY